MDGVTDKPARRRRTAPTISDVARRAGVSQMTVSRVLNREGSVRPSTRDTVNQAIADLRYAPNPAARSLAGAGQTRVGILYSNPSAGFLSEFLLGSLDGASRAGVQLIVERCDIGDHEVEVTRRLMEGGIDGVILPPPICESAAVLAVLAEAKVPTVAVATGSPPEEMMAVSIDDRLAAHQMTAHVIALGHRRIGFVAGHPNLSASARRLEGYRDALAARGLPADEGLIAPGLFSYRSGLDAADALLDRENPPTAIFASNDDMAAAVVAVAHRRGLDVPGDLTVCGFDDAALSTAIWPELTTIHQPIAAMSRVAIDMLVAAIRQPARGLEAHRLLDFTLVRRQSDAAPRRRPQHLIGR